MLGEPRVGAEEESDHGQGAGNRELADGDLGPQGFAVGALDPEWLAARDLDPEWLAGGEVLKASGHMWVATAAAAHESVSLGVGGASLGTGGGSLVTLEVTFLARGVPTLRSVIILEGPQPGGGVNLKTGVSFLRLGAVGGAMELILYVQLWSSVCIVPMPGFFCNIFKHVNIL